MARRPTVSVPAFALGPKESMSSEDGEFWVTPILDHRRKRVAEVAALTVRESRRFARLILADLESRAAHA